jgi:hypothetical protein
MVDKATIVSGSGATPLGRLLKGFREFFYGMTVRELELESHKQRSQINNLFMLVVFGDLAGLPLLPSYYALRLLPYFVPSLNSWKRSLNRERDITDLGTVDL